MSGVHDEPGGGPPAPTLEKAQPAADPRPAADPDPGPAGPAMAQSASAARYEPDGRPQGPAGRFWSPRRVPATLLGAALLGACGLLLYDVVAVRSDRPAAGWRRDLADGLATRTLDDGWVVCGAVVAVLLGVWLVVLAVSPGLRGLLPMRPEGADLRAGLERRAAAVVLRDRALDVSGVRAVRVVVGRRRVRVQAEAHFRDLDEVRADLDQVLDHGLGELGLARQLALAVQVSRPVRR